MYAEQNQPNVLSIIAIVLGAVAVLFLPILLGPAAIVCAVVAKTVRKERLANVALIVSVAGTVVGLVLGAIIGATMMG